MDSFTVKGRKNILLLHYINYTCCYDQNKSETSLLTRIQNPAISSLLLILLEQVKIHSTTMRSVDTACTKRTNNTLIGCTFY